MLLRKLSHEGRHNRLFVASRELGRVLRTIYLLKWISNKEMRQEVSATTNKIESYHAFTKWLNFGGDVILQNTVGMMRALQSLDDAGEHGDPADVEYLSPYMTSSIKRFGNYHLDLKRAREPWLKEALFQEVAQRTRVAAQSAGSGGQQQ
jgi:Tn3 transposase DDE domain